MPKSKKSLIILGVDPGLADTGFGLVLQEGNRLKMINYGTIKTKVKSPIEVRLKKIYYSLNKLIKKFKPKIIGVEKLFFCKNSKTAMAVGQARGVILLSAAQNNLAVKEFTPLEIKLALTSYGRAEKNQVQQMVRAILSLKQIPKPDDAADALAIAICCANSLHSATKYE